MVDRSGSLRVAAVLVALAPAVYIGASGASEDDWFFDDFEARIEEVNEGELHFLGAPPAKKVHHHENHVAIDASSLEHGWVDLHQCHANLDAVPRLQVMFRAGGTEDLKIVSTHNVGSAYIDGPSIQLTDVGRHARLCLSARSQALHGNGDGVYVLRNGPYMRRFLDGYYPMRVEMKVTYPCGMLELVASSPEGQPGFRLEMQECGVAYDTWFEGRLRTELVFRRPAAPSS
ncbi:MAG: hypothetical protein U5S82_06405 [Gammaproteobacteria bacterium]|nr:hypothetical protein [Gammaproteobacteria bacterium]